MGQAGSRLTCVVVKLHEAEDQVCGDELELVGWVSDDIPVNKQTHLNLSRNLI